MIFPNLAEFRCEFRSRDEFEQVFILAVVVFYFLEVNEGFAKLLFENSIDVSAEKIARGVRVPVRKSLVDLSRHLAHLQLGLTNQAVFSVFCQAIEYQRDNLISLSLGFACVCPRFRSRARKLVYSN